MVRALRSHKGFTLVEMAVLISIFGLVIAVGTPPIARFLRHLQARDAAQFVSGLLRQARAKAVHERNNYVVFFNIAQSTITFLDDDGGGNGNPQSPAFDPQNRGNGAADAGERIYGPFRLPAGQVFGLVAGTLGPDGRYVTTPVTFSGSPPRVIFYPNGSTNEEGLIMVMPEAEFRSQTRGADKMLIVRRSTGSVTIMTPQFD